MHALVPAVQVMELLGSGPPFQSDAMASALKELLIASPMKKEESAENALGPLGQGTWEVGLPAGCFEGRFMQHHIDAA
jgi:hypothetical protein